VEVGSRSALSCTCITNLMCFVGSEFENLVQEFYISEFVMYC
jgi:hypothetical protein